jgi:O-antigen/teichoic acid export membrane protein
MLTMITTPYTAAIVAHENMNVYAAVSIVEAVLKLAVAFVIQIFLFDKLTLYGTLLFIVAFINTGIYRGIAVKKYPECTFKVYWNYPLFRELTSYIGWNLFGTLTDVVKSQGINIVLNMYFGPIVNAARALSRQVDMAVRNFAKNYTTAARPQIIKYYATENRRKMLTLVFRASKGAYFLLFFFVLPIELELPFLFDIWLKKTPDYVLDFTRILLINTLIDTIGFSLNSASQATGNIKLYQGISGGILLLNLPFAIIALKAGCSPVSVQIIGIGLSVFALTACILLLARQLEFSVWQFFHTVILPIIAVTVFAGIIPAWFVHITSQGMIRLILTTVISIISIAGSIVLFGVTKIERAWITGKIKGFRQ